MKMNALLVLGAWILLSVTIVMFILGISGLNVNEHLVINTLWVFVFFVIGHVVLAICLTCPNCGKRPTIQGMKPIHPTSKKIPGLDGWSTVVVNIIKNNQFRCIHCGTDYHL